MQSNSAKVYVTVNVAFRDDGQMLPCSILWEDGRRYDIDRVLTVRPAYAEKAGGQGDRYTVTVHGSQRYLFFERCPDELSPQIGRWFVERR